MVQGKIWTIEFLKKMNFKLEKEWNNFWVFRENFHGAFWSQFTRNYSYVYVCVHVAGKSRIRKSDTNWKKNARRQKSARDEIRFERENTRRIYIYRHIYFSRDFTSRIKHEWTEELKLFHHARAQYYFDRYIFEFNDFVRKWLFGFWT